MVSTVVEGNIPVEVTLDTGLLFVAIKVRDITAGLPGSAVGFPIPMVEFDVGNYVAVFTGVAGKLYAVSKAVYTDGTYAMRNPDQPSGSDAFQVTTAHPTPVAVSTNTGAPLEAELNNASLGAMGDDTVLEAVGDDTILQAAGNDTVLEDVGDDTVLEAELVEEDLVNV